jgi:carbonic anhydrase/acetyltransferase-like protein (isoleucine patch superfamily)
MLEESIILYASGSNIIVDFEEICLTNNISIAVIINNRKYITSCATFQEKVIDISQIASIDLSIPFICPLFTPQNRFIAVNEALQSGLWPYNLLSDKNNDLPCSFKNGNGCFINKRVVIGAQSEIGDFVFINRGASLGHHLYLDNFVSIGPGVVIGGNVTIERGTLVGMGAVILPEVKIGKHVIVGAGSVVTKNVADYSIVVGNPARKIKLNDVTF